MKKETYKFRAECLYDVIKFMQKATFKYDLKISKKSGFPDVIVEISTKESIFNLASIIASIDDAHVMIETIQLRKLYTGERDQKKCI